MKNKKRKIISIKKEKDNNKRNKIIVNAITGIRTIGTFAMIPIYTIYGSLTTALAAGVFFLTDMIDGKLARKLHVQSFFGSLLDGLSDKTFGMVCLLLLALENNIFFIPIIMEGAILAINFQSLQRGNNVQSSIAGKVKTGVLAVSLVGGFLSLEVPSLKDLLNYLNIKSIDTLLNTNPSVLSNIVATPLIASETIVIVDYIKKAKDQDKKRIESATSNKEIAKLNTEIDEIQAQKEYLLNEKNKLKVSNSQLKTKKEIVHDLFDTDFYLENKDGGIKKLLFKNNNEKEV